MYDQIQIKEAEPQFKEQLFFAVSPSVHINNRSDKRAFRKDAVRAGEYLQHIIDEFFEALFDAPKTINYNTIYIFYLDLWVATIRHMGTVKPKMKNIAINKNFFAENYAPVV